MVKTKKDLKIGSVSQGDRNGCNAIFLYIKEMKNSRFYKTKWIPYTFYGTCYIFGTMTIYNFQAVEGNTFYNIFFTLYGHSNEGEVTENKSICPCSKFFSKLKNHVYLKPCKLLHYCH